MNIPLDRISAVDVGRWEPPGPNACDLERALMHRADLLVERWERDVDAVAESLHDGWDLDAVTAQALVEALRVGEKNVSASLAELIGRRMIHEVRQCLELKAWNEVSK